MKKFLSLFAIAAMSLTLFTACDNDDEAPELKPVDVSEGVFIVNSGNQRSSIDGSLTYINTTEKVATQNVFKNANGKSLGGTVNDAIVYGTKLYLVVTDENTIEVVDRNSIKELKQIKTTDLLGDTNGSKPRHITAGNGIVYVSTYGGYVAAIDTASYTLTKSYKVGSYPEGLTLDGNGKMYVANSDYAMGNASISEVDLASGTSVELKNELIKNPVSVAYANGSLYILDSGTYETGTWKQVGAGVIKYSNGSFSKVLDATMMSVVSNSNGAYIYYINNPYLGTDPIAYGKYNVSTEAKTTFIAGSDIVSPNAIGADPITGKVYILSYPKDHDTGYASYTLPGYVNEYDSDGNFLKKYDAGVGPTTLTFNTATIYE